MALCHTAASNLPKTYVTHFTLIPSTYNETFIFSANKILAISSLFNSVLHDFQRFCGFVPCIHRIEIESSLLESTFLGECRALSHLGAVHMALQNYTHAIKCYQEQLERAQDLQDSSIEAEAFGNLGIAKLNRYVHCALSIYINQISQRNWKI